MSLLLLLGSPPLAAGASPDPIVASASTNAAGLYFDAPVPLPWHSWLPPHLEAASQARDAARRRELFAQRSDFGFTEVAFFRPTPPDLQRRFYYPLDPSGVRPIRLTGLRGTARIEWSDSGEVRAVHAFGHVVAANPGAGPGGFVLVSEQPRRLRGIPSRRTADALLAPTGGTYVGRGTAFWEIVTQYEVVENRPDARAWLFVQWKPDEAVTEAGCQRRFTLFQTRPILEQVARPATTATSEAGCSSTHQGRGRQLPATK